MRRKVIVAGLVGLSIVAVTAGVGITADQGAGAGEIKVGNTAAYSGPVSAYAGIYRTIGAYLKMINDQGGINGHKLVFISYDDGYTPPRTVEMTRRLVERDHVLLDFAPQGTPTSIAVREYLNRSKVPQLFVATGWSGWGDPRHYPWTMGWQPSYAIEAAAYAQYVRRHVAHPKVAILYQNDSYGRDFLEGFKKELGPDAAKIIVKEQTYEVTDATIDSQVVNLRDSGANVFFDVTAPKFTSQAIRKAYSLGWHPVHLLNSVSASVTAVLKPAGLEASKGVISAAYLKDPGNPQLKDDSGTLRYLAFMKKNEPQADAYDPNNVYGYTIVQTLVYVLKRAGKDLSAEAIMKQAAHIDNLRLDMLLPGVAIHTSPTDFYPLHQVRLAQFDGARWQLVPGVFGATTR